MLKANKASRAPESGKMSGQGMAEPLDLISFFSLSLSFCVCFRVFQDSFFFFYVALATLELAL